MHGPINAKSPNNTSKWQMGFNSAFKGLIITDVSSQRSDSLFKSRMYNVIGHSSPEEGNSGQCRNGENKSTSDVV
jgi:hypothetical protein